MEDKMMKGRSIGTLGLILLAVASGMSAIGCGDKGGAETPDLNIAGNRQPAGEFLPGSWEGKIALNEELAKQEFNEETIDSLKSMRMTVKFANDGSMEVAAMIQTPQGPMNSDSAGTWKVLEDEGEKIRLLSTEEDGTEEEIQLRVADANTFEMDAPGEQKELAVMRFSRLR